MNGTLTFGSGSLYAVTVNAAGQSGVTAVVGNLVFGVRSTLAVTVSAGWYSAGTAYRIITSARVGAIRETRCASRFAYTEL